MVSQLMIKIFSVGLVYLREWSGPFNAVPRLMITKRR